MDTRIFCVLEVLSDYDDTLFMVIDACISVDKDPVCDEATMSMFEAALVSVLLDKTAHLLPEGEEEQNKILAVAEGIEEVFANAPHPESLITQITIGYAVALSQSRWGWKPWELVKQILLEGEKDDELAERSETA